MDLSTITSLRPARSRADLALAPGEGVLGGGSWLFSTPQPHLSGLVDLTTLGWTPLERLDDGGLRIAATCTIAELASATTGPVRDLARACAEALLMSFKVQQVATVGGNLCLALPAGSMTALAATLDGEVVVWTPDGGERREPVADFVQDVGVTGLAPGEVVRAIELPAYALEARSAVRKVALTPVGRSSSLVAGRVDADGTTVLTLTAATTRPVVLRYPSPPAAGLLRTAVDSVDCWYDDPHGPPDWRRAVTLLLAERVRAELAS